MAYPRHRADESANERAGHLREVGADAEPETRSVGQDLAEVRKQQGGDLHEIAEDLRIRYDHLLALEEARFDDLPGPTYVVGFLRSYATYLGLDAEQLIQRFKSEAADFGAQPKLHFPSPAEEGRLPTATLLLLALALAGAAYGGWYYVTSIEYVSTDRVPEVPGRLAELAPAPETTQTEPSSTGTSRTLALTPPGDASSAPAAIEIGRDAAAGTAVVAQEDEAAAAPEPATTPAPAQPEPPAALAAGEAPAAVTAAEGETAAPSAPGVTVVTAEPSAPTEPTVTVVETETAVAVVETETAVTVVETEAAVPSAPSSAEPGRDADEAGVETQTAAVDTRAATVPTDATTTRGSPPTAPVAPAEETTRPTVAAPAAAAAETSPASEGIEVQEITTAVATVEVPPPEIDLGDYVPRVFGRGNAGSRIQVRAREEVWVQITGADDELLLTRILRPGDVYHVPDRSGLVLMTGNAAGIEILVDGELAPPLGPVGAVRRDVQLDPVGLLRRPETDIR